MKKRNNLFTRIASITLVAVLMLSLTACDFGSSSSDSSNSSKGSSYSPSTYTSPYVNMVKNATHKTYGIQYGTAFNAFFSSPKWSYFKASSGEHVVEFEGTFSYDGAPAKAKIQFVVDVDEGTFTAYHLSIDGVAQSKILLSTLIKKVFESY